MKSSFPVFGRGPNYYSEGKNEVHNLCLPEGKYDFRISEVELHEVSCYDKSLAKFKKLQTKDDGLYHTNDCKPSVGLIVSSTSDNGLRFVDTDLRVGKIGGVVTTKKIADEYARGYRVCFADTPYDSTSVSRCLPDPAPLDFGAVQTIPNGTDIPIGAKYLVVQTILKRPFVNAAFSVDFDPCMVKLSPDASFAIVASPSGLYKVYRGHNTIELLAGTLAHDEFDYANGIGRESRFYKITSGAMATKNKFMYVSDYFNGGSIRKVDLVSGSVNSIYRGPSATAPGIISIELSMDENILILLLEDGSVKRISAHSGTVVDTVLSGPPIGLQKCTCIATDRHDLFAYCLYGNSLGKIELKSFDAFSTVLNNVFTDPTGLVIDKTNNIAYISNSGNGLIKKVYLSADDTSVGDVEIAFFGGYLDRKGP